MKACTPESNIGRTVGGDDIHHLTADQRKAAAKAAAKAKAAKHASRKDGRRAGGDPHEGMADPSDGYGM